MAPLFYLLILAVMGAHSAFAHPGHDVHTETREHAEWLQTRNPRSVRRCRSHIEGAVARRQELAHQLRARHEISARSVSPPPYNISHASSLDVTVGSDETLLFADNSSCILQPETTVGPYYIDGELIRRNLSESQPGVPLYLDVQLINTATCAPVSAVFVDAWHANATGVYSGIVASGNSNDTSNTNTTFGRGIQQTDVNGVVQFETIYPGHYTGRAHHIHILSHPTTSTIVRTNGTILSSNATHTTASHVGQVYFDDDLSARIEATEPYASHDQPLTLNSQDPFLLASIQASAASDPLVEYVLLDLEDISKGILAWISLGIDNEGTGRECESAATLYADGGEQNEGYDYAADRKQGVNCA